MGDSDYLRWMIEVYLRRGGVVDDVEVVIVRAKSTIGFYVSKWPSSASDFTSLVAAEFVQRIDATTDPITCEFSVIFRASADAVRQRIARQARRSRHEDLDKAENEQKNNLDTTSNLAILREIIAGFSAEEKAMLMSHLFGGRETSPESKFSKRTIYRKLQEIRRRLKPDEE